MKNLSILISIRALLSLVSGILTSKMSFIGKIGVSTFYSQYAVSKTWWKTVSILFTVQFVLLLFLQTLRAKVSVGLSRLLAVLSTIIRAAEAYLTYIDLTTMAHRAMKFSLHTGFYLFWIT